jgi:triosephosphate isomerase
MALMKFMVKQVPAMRKTLLIGSWKMNGNFAEIKILLRAITASYDASNVIETVVCLSSIYSVDESKQQQQGIAI